MMSVHRSIIYKVACTYTCINERGKTTLCWLWNSVTVEMFDNWASKFASSVLLWTNFSPIRNPGEIMSFGVSPIKER